jgi:hypothetical protein
MFFSGSGMIFSDRIWFLVPQHCYHVKNSTVTIFLSFFRSKSLLNEIETLYDEQHEQEEQGLVHPARGPHLTTTQYKDKTMLDDATQLLIHHVKRQTCIHKEDKQRIKQFLRHSLPDMFHHARQAWTNQL